MRVDTSVCVCVCVCVQWAERGGLDFEGRARWDAWTAVKGLQGDKARMRFVRSVCTHTHTQTHTHTHTAQNEMSLYAQISYIKAGSRTYPPGCLNTCVCVRVCVCVCRLYYEFTPTALYKDTRGVVTA